MSNIWTGDRWGQLRLWPAQHSHETEKILYEFIYISWELCENRNRKDAHKREIGGHQKFLVVLNYARLHYKLVVQLKSNMKYYPGKSTGISKYIHLRNNKRPVWFGSKQHPWGKQNKGWWKIVCQNVVYMFILTTAILGSWERQHAKKLCFIKVLINQNSPICFLATTPSSNERHTPSVSPHQQGCNVFLKSP